MGSNPKMRKQVKALATSEVVTQFSIQRFGAAGSTPADFAKYVAQQSAFMNDLACKIEFGSK